MTQVNGKKLIVKEKKEMVLAGGFSLQPKTLDEAMAFAKLMADSDLVPKDFKGKPGNVLIAVQMGAEIDLPPMQAIQNIAVINGRPGIFGDVGKAVLRSKGCKIDERDIKEVEKTQEAWCKITRPNGESQERTYSVANAKTAKLWGKEGPWSTNPYRQMAWRAFWFCARDTASDMLKGLAGAEELMDYPPERVVETTAVKMPQPLPTIDEVMKQREQQKEAAQIDKAATQPQEAPPAPSKEYSTATIQIEDGRRFKNGKCEVMDNEGVTYACTEAQAKHAHDNKDRVADITFEAVNDGQPILHEIKIKDA